MKRCPTFVLGDLGYVYARVGKRDQAMAVIRELEDRNARNESAGMYIAGVHLGLGENDQAFVAPPPEFSAGIIRRWSTDHSRV